MFVISYFNERETELLGTEDWKPKPKAEAQVIQLEDEGVSQEEVYEVFSDVSETDTSTSDEPPKELGEVEQA